MKLSDEGVRSRALSVEAEEVEFVDVAVIVSVSEEVLVVDSVVSICAAELEMVIVEVLGAMSPEEVTFVATVEVLSDVVLEADVFGIESLEVSEGGMAESVSAGESQVVDVVVALTVRSADVVTASDTVGCASGKIDEGTAASPEAGVTVACPLLPEEIVKIVVDFDG